ncbi:hypothetical protein DPMN_060861 [Dreissena polymorpha]|uniref:C2H2-type domain-containing protein n=1 Tax=Dreissena polymorpha TaxID=45954 RepID=A0A9D4C6S1_DREPO|nr:hypothetical protein DPMN_060861 [Dreissena polymorpha]
MEISFLDSSILDESIEVVIDFNSNEVLTSTPIVKKQKVDLFACPSCAYNTNSRGNLYRHKRSVHQKKKEECPTCEKNLRLSIRSTDSCKSCSRRKPIYV